MKPNANPFRGVVLLICVLALIFCATSIFRTTTHQTTYSYADIRDLFQQEKVETVQVDEDTLTLTLKEPVNGNNVVTYSIYSFQLFYDDFNDIVVQQYEDGIISDYDYPDSPSPAWMSTILTWVIILVVMSLLMYFLFFRRAQGGGGGGPSAAQFGKARARTLAETGRTVTAFSGSSRNARENCRSASSGSTRTGGSSAAFPERSAQRKSSSSTGVRKRNSSSTLRSCFPVKSRKRLRRITSGYRLPSRPVNSIGLTGGAGAKFSSLSRRNSPPSGLLIPRVRRPAPALTR